MHKKTNLNAVDADRVLKSIEVRPFGGKFIAEFPLNHKAHDFLFLAIRGSKADAMDAGFQAIVNSDKLDKVLSVLQRRESGEEANLLRSVLRSTGGTAAAVLMSFVKVATATGVAVELRRVRRRVEAVAPDPVLETAA